MMTRSDKDPADVFFSAVEKIKPWDVLGKYVDEVKQLYEDKLKWKDIKIFHRPTCRNDYGERVFEYSVLISADLKQPLDLQSNQHVVVDFGLQGHEGVRYPMYKLGYEIRFFSKPKDLPYKDAYLGVHEDFDHLTFEGQVEFREAQDPKEEDLAHPAEEVMTQERLERYMHEMGKSVIRLLGTLITVGLIASSQTKKYVYYFLPPSEGEDEKDVT